MDALSLLRVRQDAQADSDQLNAIQKMTLAEFCERYLYIQDKDGAIIPLVLNRAQRHFAENMTGRDWVLKARQLGFTTVIRAFCYKRSIEQSLRLISLAHDDKTTQKMRRMEKIYYEHMPPMLGISRTQDNAAITSYSNMSEVTLATAGSKEGGRGGTYNIFHGSELAFWGNAASIFSGAMQGVPKNGVVIVESTPNGAQGIFYEEVQKIRNGESEYTLHFYPWWWDDDYAIPLQDGEQLAYTAIEQALVDKHGLTPEQIKWRRKKIAEPGMADLFAQEYPEDSDTCFLTSGDSAFPNIHTVMGAPVQEKPIPGHVYVAGLDWGQDNDSTALSIYDRTERREVYLDRWRREPYRNIRSHVIDACIAWNVTEITPERNSMSTNIEDLHDDFDARGYRIAITPLIMSNPVKHELVTNFKTGYQEQGMQLLDVDYAKQEMNIFVKKQTPTLLWTYAAEGDGHDDTVIARLLGWNAVLGGWQIIEDSAPSALKDYRG
jgi:hypothetical protein